VLVGYLWGLAVDLGVQQGWLTSAVADGPAMGNEGAWLYILSS